MRRFGQALATLGLAVGLLVALPSSASALTEPSGGGGGTLTCSSDGNIYFDTPQVVGDHPYSYTFAQPWVGTWTSSGWSWEAGSWIYSWGDANAVYPGWPEYGYDDWYNPTSYSVVPDTIAQPKGNGYYAVAWLVYEKTPGMTNPDQGSGWSEPLWVWPQKTFGGSAGNGYCQVITGPTTPGNPR